MTEPSISMAAVYGCILHARAAGADRFDVQIKPSPGMQASLRFRHNGTVHGNSLQGCYIRAFQTHAPVFTALDGDGLNTAVDLVVDKPASAFYRELLDATAYLPERCTIAYDDRRVDRGPLPFMEASHAQLFDTINTPWGPLTAAVGTFPPTRPALLVRGLAYELPFPSGSIIVNGIYSATLRVLVDGSQADGLVHTCWHEGFTPAARLRFLASVEKPLQDLFYGFLDNSDAFYSHDTWRQAAACGWNLHVDPQAPPWQSHTNPAPRRPSLSPLTDGALRVELSGGRHCDAALVFDHHQDLQPISRHPGLTGYPWFERLPVLRDVTVHVTSNDGDVILKGNPDEEKDSGREEEGIGNFEHRRAHRIYAVLTIERQGTEEQREVDLPWILTGPRSAVLSGVLYLGPEAQDKDPEGLIHHLADAGFRPYDLDEDGDGAGPSLQKQYFQEEATYAAYEALQGSREAARRTALLASRQHVLPALPRPARKATTLTITISGDDVQVVAKDNSLQ